MKKALVCGAGGFIGAHLARRLVNEGYHVRGVDVKMPEFGSTAAHEFVLADLRDRNECARALDGGFDEVYQLAADMGGMGFIHSAVCEIMRNNVLINVNMIDAAAEAKASRYFYSSSVCVYRDMAIGEPEISEAEAYPALPDNDYGWEKLYSERVVTAYGERYGIATRIARFQNTYGPQGTWRGGREKAPAAICRKVAEAPDGGEVEVWGDGSAVRSYTYVEDLIDGIRLLVASDHAEPINIGNPEYVSVNELVATVAEVAGKRVTIRHVDGPVGVQSRNFANGNIEGLGFVARYPLRRGIEQTYPWVAAQVEAAQASSSH
jgi:nucleoside-diphosphate-sugar epimerase